MEIKFLLIKKGPIETALTKLKDAHKLQDIASIDASLNELNAAWTAASEDIYKAQQADANPNGGTGAGQQEPQGANATAGDNVTDAEFEEVK